MRQLVLVCGCLLLACAGKAEEKAAEGEARLFTTSNTECQKVNLPTIEHYGKPTLIEDPKIYRWNNFGAAKDPMADQKNLYYPSDAVYTQKNIYRNYPSHDGSFGDYGFRTATFGPSINRGQVHVPAEGSFGDYAFGTATFGPTVNRGQMHVPAEHQWGASSQYSAYAIQPPTFGNNGHLAQGGNNPKAPLNIRKVTLELPSPQIPRITVRALDDAKVPTPVALRNLEQDVSERHTLEEAGFNVKGFAEPRNLKDDLTDAQAEVEKINPTDSRIYGGRLV